MFCQLHKNYFLSVAFYAANAIKRTDYSMKLLGTVVLVQNAENMLKDKPTNGGVLKTI